MSQLNIMHVLHRTALHIPLLMERIWLQANLRLTLPLYLTLKEIALDPLELSTVLAQRLGCVRSTFARNTVMLVKKGLLALERDPLNGRRVQRTITKNGHEMLKAMTLHWDEVLDLLEKELSELKINRLIKELKQLEDASVVIGYNKLGEKRWKEANR